MRPAGRDSTRLVIQTEIAECQMIARFGSRLKEWRKKVILFVKIPFFSANIFKTNTAIVPPENKSYLYSVISTHDVYKNINPE